MIATETITLTSPDFDENDPDWVLVEDDCPNPDDPDSPCNQIYVKKDEVTNYKNKKILEKGLRAADSVQPTKTDEYLELDKYFDIDNPPDKVHVWARFSLQASSESDYKNNKIIGYNILESLTPEVYSIDVEDEEDRYFFETSLELGIMAINVNRQGLSDLYHNHYILSFHDPDRPR